MSTNKNKQYVFGEYIVCFHSHLNNIFVRYLILDEGSSSARFSSNSRISVLDSAKKIDNNYHTLNWVKFPNQRLETFQESKTCNILKLFLNTMSIPLTKSTKHSIATRRISSKCPNLKKQGGKHLKKITNILQ